MGRRRRSGQGSQARSGERPGRKPRGLDRTDKGRTAPGAAGKQEAMGVQGTAVHHTSRTGRLAAGESPGRQGRLGEAAALTCRGIRGSANERRHPNRIKTAQRSSSELCRWPTSLGLGPKQWIPRAEWLFSPAAVLADLADPASYPCRFTALPAPLAGGKPPGRLCRFWPGLPKVAWCIRPASRARLCMAARGSWPPSSPSGRPFVSIKA